MKFYGNSFSIESVKRFHKIWSIWPNTIVLTETIETIIVSLV